MRQPRRTGTRRDRWLLRVPPEHAFELAADPSRFPEFNPTVRVPANSGRVEVLGNVYYQLFGIGPLRLTMRWETVAVDPPNLADRPRPSLPWTTAEVGTMPLLGTWRSTSRYDAVTAGTLVTHDLEYELPAGRLGPVVDLMLRPALGISFEFLARRLKRWIESARPADSTADRGE
jgi:uncharacterized membrane protein